MGHFKNYKPEMIADLNPASHDDMLKFQDTWKVGHISKVLYDVDDDSWKALIKPLPQFEEKSFPPFCSCAVFQDDMSEPAGQISKWRGIHLAGLIDKPAFGDQSIYQGTCNNTLEKCELEFSTPKSILETQLKLSNSKVSALLSTDNPQVDIVDIFNSKILKTKS